MTAKMEFKGKDIDEAINKACARYSVTREKLNIEIVSTGSTGIFGLCKKKAIIQATIKEQSPSTPKKNQKQQRPAQTGKKAQPPRANTKKSGPETDNREIKPALRETNPPKAAPQKTVPSVEVREKGHTQKVTPPTPELIDFLKSNLNRLLELMGFPSEVTASEKGNKIYLQLSGDFNEQLTTKDGQLLDSLQYLLRKMITAKFTQKVLFSIDADNFREARRETLIEQALQLAGEAKETGKTKTIPPLNPAERRIVHMALQDDSTIRSRSVGDGLFKKIIIYLPGTEKRRPSRRNRGKKTTQGKKPSTGNNNGSSDTGAENADTAS